MGGTDLMMNTRLVCLLGLNAPRRVAIGKPVGGRQRDNENAPQKVVG